MNRLVIFDLDGVLVDSRELHYDSLNAALLNIGEEFVISRDEHLATYDGLSTTKKLELLSKNKKLPTSLHKEVWLKKQKATFNLINNFSKNENAINIFKKLRINNFKIAVASNSIRETLKLSLIRLGLIEYVDYFVSNEDVKMPKPYPEMYWKCMINCNALPRNTLILEDSHIGRQGAIDSGANLLEVKNVSDLDIDKILSKLNLMEKTSSNTIVPWRDSKLNVLIPMAGAGSRFQQLGYTFPKPLIEVNGKPMIQVVVENLNLDAHFIFIVQKDHYEKYHLKHLLNLIAPKCDIIQVEGLTEGAACTSLLAKSNINNENPLIIANSDQYIKWNSNECMYAFSADKIDGGILTFEATHPKWSYAKVDNNGFVVEVAEKQVISNNATVGVYYWKQGQEYIKYAEQMISKNIRVNNEFYICPVYNQAIADNKKIKIKKVEKMWGIGTPEDLEYFLKSNEINIT